MGILILRYIFLCSFVIVTLHGQEETVLSNSAKTLCFFSNTSQERLACRGRKAICLVHLVCCVKQLDSTPTPNNQKFILRFHECRKLVVNYMADQSCSKVSLVHCRPFEISRDKKEHFTPNCTLFSEIGYHGNASSYSW